MLRKLTPQHRDIILRLVAGQPPHKIAIELGMSSQTISSLQRDPLFAAELRDLEQSAKVALLERISAMEILEQAANNAAKVCSEAVGEGEIQGEPISAKTRLNAAFKLLDKLGLDRSKEKKQAEQESLADLVIDAYERGRDGRKRDTVTIESLNQNVTEVTPEEDSYAPKENSLSDQSNSNKKLSQV